MNDLFFPSPLLQYEVSLQLLARMKRLGVVANLITYNTVISAGAKGGLPWEGLIDLFAQMRHDGIQVRKPHRPPTPPSPSEPIHLND